MRESLNSETLEFIIEIVGGVLGTALATYIATARAIKQKEAATVDPTDTYTLSVYIDEILKLAEQDKELAKKLAEALNHDEVK